MNGLYFLLQTPPGTPTEAEMNAGDYPGDGSNLDYGREISNKVMSGELTFSSHQVPKKSAHVKWQGRSIALGTFPIPEARAKIIQARELTKEFRQSRVGRSMTRDDVIEELERRRIRIVASRRGSTISEGSHYSAVSAASTATAATNTQDWCSVIPDCPQPPTKRARVEFDTVVTTHHPLAYEDVESSRSSSPLLATTIAEDPILESLQLSGFDVELEPQPIKGEDDMEPIPFGSVSDYLGKCYEQSEIISADSTSSSLWSSTTSSCGTPGFDPVNLIQAASSTDGMKYEELKMKRQNLINQLQETSESLEFYKTNFTTEAA